MVNINCNINNNYYFKIYQIIYFSLKENRENESFQFASHAYHVACTRKKIIRDLVVDIKYYPLSFIEFIFEYVVYQHISFRRITYLRRALAKLHSLAAREQISQFACAAYTR